MVIEKPQEPEKIPAIAIESEDIPVVVEKVAEVPKVPIFNTESEYSEYVPPAIGSTLDPSVKEDPPFMKDLGSDDGSDEDPM